MARGLKYIFDFMNPHPFIVHFPVAFLSVYCLLELVRIRYITSAVYWFYVKASMVIIGTAGAGAAYLTGEIAEELYGKTELVEIHSKFAKLSVIVFCVISAIYIVAWLSRLELLGKIENALKLNENSVYMFLKKALNYFAESFIMILPALVGLVCIVITGALGGALVYGPDIDPFVRIIYDLVMAR